MAFVFIGPVSSSIFAAWTCEAFALDSIANPPTKIAFLVADLSLRCEDSDEEYARVKSLAHIFIGLWPLGTPLIFLAVLLRCGIQILQGR
eukprot:2976452-Prymnesium_polylepis.1